MQRAVLPLEILGALGEIFRFQMRIEVQIRKPISTGFAAGVLDGCNFVID